MRRDLADAVVGRVRDPDAVPRAGRGVDGVEAGADPAHDAEPRQRRDDALRDRRILQENPRATGRGRDHLVLGLALRSDELDTGGGEEIPLDLQLGKLVVGKQDFGHGDDGVDRGRGRRSSPSATRKGTWPRGDWSSGLTDSDRIGPAAAPIIPHPCPSPARPSEEYRDDQAPANDDRRQPAQARLARRTEDALGPVAARGRSAGRGHRGRRPPRRSRPGARRGSTSSPTASRRAAIS